MKELELLSPAKDLNTAREAILHGADAVYLGAPKFGARQAAPVSIEDISTLVAEAHIFGVKIYIALNTIIFDNELDDVKDLIHRLYEVGVDAIIIQDMGITELPLPPIALHASTQCHNNDAQQLKRLETMGFEQAVLARELNPQEIAQLHQQTNIKLEAFVHGAICVSYSGRCYLSEHVCGRSANRGACAQMCRQTYDLIDAKGEIIYQQKYLLSAKDMNRSNSLDALIEAGVSSFKIEGRLKGVSYVKNTTAYYRQAIDAFIAKNPTQYKRSSKGVSSISFVPQLDKSFNRGFTENYFHQASPNNKNENIVNIDTPKSIGEFMGKVKSTGNGFFTLDQPHDFNNADGIIYITNTGNYDGAQINHTESNGRCEINKKIVIPVGTHIYRNYDHQFEQLLGKNTASRKIEVKIILRDVPHGLAVEISDGEHAATSCVEVELEKAKNYQEDKLRDVLAKLGNTPFEAREIDINLSERFFVPASYLAELKRSAVEVFMRTLRIKNSAKIYRPTLSISDKKRSIATNAESLEKTLDYSANIANQLARRHYTNLGAKDLKPAYELSKAKDASLMITKHCVRRLLGYCTKETKLKPPFTFPLYLKQGDRRFKLLFDCQACMMHILAEKN